MLFMGHPRGAYWYGSRLSIQFGEIGGVYSDWPPLEHHSGLFPEDLDDPWQFKTFRAQ